MYEAIMGKQIKAQAASAGRVPLVQDDKPLLYPRYNTIEELLNICKRDKSLRADDDVDPGAEDHPSKKLKTTGAVDEPLNGNRAAASSGKGFGVVGEDGLTYKQRRQLRRAAERATKDGVGAAGTASSADPAIAAHPDANGYVDATKKKKHKMEGKQGMKDGDANGVASTLYGGEGAKGNAEEAARMRAVLGFTSPSPGEDAGSLQFAALTPTSIAAAAAGVDNSSIVATAAASLGKKQKNEESSDKRKKSEIEQEGKGRQREVPGANGKSLERGTGSGGLNPPQRQRSLKGEGQGQGQAAAAMVDAARQQPGGGGGNTIFSFDFQLQETVEAETEARLARLMALDSTKDGFVPRRIWVSGMPHEFDEDTIREYWGYCGEIESLHLLTFPDSGNFNGTAYITFKTQVAYEAALACNGEVLEGRALRVEKCKAAAELKGKARISVATTAKLDAAGSGVGGGGSRGGNGRVAGYPVAYCGNISFEVGDEELQQLFSGAGAVPSKVRLHLDKASGRSKGYAHIHFTSDEDVDKAVALDGTSFHGRKIRVSYAQPKPGEL